MDENKSKKEAGNGPLLKSLLWITIIIRLENQFDPAQPIKQDDQQVIAMNDTKITIILS